ncbi:MAG: TetR/AcrR family transcriptional regulator [Bacteroides sp.]|nr:TetR/AcrR family transcriptional regulator [Bacteroides sp.]
MERADLPIEQYNSLLDSIFTIIVEKGLAHTSMDFVASRLGMSKRTLYEIFGSKDEMLNSMLDHQHALHKANIDKIFNSSSNTMEGLARVIKYQQEVFRKINKSFFKDMDERFKNLRHDYNHQHRKLNIGLGKAIITGMRQGVFRKGIDFELLLTLLRVQMESLKRMEDFFPPEITLSRAYEAIAQSFLRSIATPKGIEILENLNIDNQNI